MAWHPGSLRVVARRASIALAAVLVLGALTPAAASPRSQVEEARDQLEGIEERIRIEQEAAASLQAEISGVADEVGVEQAAYERTQVDLLNARAAFALAQTEYSALQDRLEDRAQQALFLSEGSAAEVLLESDSFSEVGDRIEFLNQLQLADAALARQVGVQANVLRQRNDDLEAALELQASILDRLDTDREELIQALEERRLHLEAISAARREAEALVSAMKERIQESLGAAVSELGSGTVSYGKWAQAFTLKLGAPTCRDNLVVLVAWQAAEGTAARYNPLATTLPMPGSTEFNSVGVQNYVSAQQGLEAIHQTLLRGAETYGYGAILSRLGECADAMETAEAINLSSWCRGCAGGAYVTGIVPIVEEYFDRYAATSV
jgi:peptidoglycan hydrolase CwlO-like protein